jgi:hypothetical protein
MPGYHCSLFIDLLAVRLLQLAFSKGLHLDLAFPSMKTLFLLNRGNHRCLGAERFRHLLSNRVRFNF